MKILWFAWKDHTHPQAGGAEVMLRQLSTRLAADGHEVTVLTARHANAMKFETIDGVRFIRVGKNRYTHSFLALIYYLRHLYNAFDAVIEEVNTAPYFGVLFPGKARPWLLYNQLAREVWFYETPLPLSLFGYYVLEPLATRLLSFSAAKTITISASSRQDLERYGFEPRRTSIISVGITIPPLLSLKGANKFSAPTVLSLGSLRAMKRTLHQVKAFEQAKQHIPDLQLKIAGDATGAYGQKVLQYIQASPFARDIEYVGRVSKAHKIQLMQQCHAIVVTSVKEGWGLIVTEAASQGTPAVVYNVDGLRDSVRHGQTGLVTDVSPSALATGITNMLQDQTAYKAMRQAAWRWSRAITFAQSYSDFKNALELP